MNTKTIFVKRNNVNIMLNDENGNTIIYFAIDANGNFYNKSQKKQFFNCLTANVDVAIFTNTILTIISDTTKIITD